MTPSTQPPEIQVFEHENLSRLWARVMGKIRADEEIGPLVASVSGFAQDQTPHLDAEVTAALDRELTAKGLNTCHTVANTIFPMEMWNPKRPRAELFARYASIRDKVLNVPANRKGTYFDRMMTGGLADEFAGNQLEFMISAFTGRDNVRRSQLQVGIFNPTLDHTTAAQVGFPCMQHLAFAKFDNTIQVNAFYATQLIDAKAYGNYLGLCHLGRFVAHELNLQLSRVTCFVSIAKKQGLSATAIDKVLAVAAKNEERDQ